jgi:hypothetical protein
MSRRLRVVQWTTGKTGKAAVRGMIGHLERILESGANVVATM